MIKEFKEIFGSLKDPRVERTKKHGLLDIIALGIMGTMAGAQSFEEMEDFGCHHETWLRQYLSLENGIPSHDTINRVFETLDPKGFQGAFLEWVQTLKSLFPETIVPIDGKTLRGSHAQSQGRKGLHVVSAWSCANGLSLGQLKVDGKTNEITVIPELLKQLMLEGAIVTMDAMGCQREIASLICQQKADYVLAVKGNQGSLSEHIKDCFKLKDDSTPVYKAKDEIGCEHGRIEEREIEVLGAEELEGLVDRSAWASLKSIIKLTYRQEEKGQIMTEERYYITSLAPQDPKKLLWVIRSHWAIESMHWSLDVTFREDNCRVRNETAALNLSWIRKMSLSLLKAETSFKASIRRKQLKLWSHPAYSLKVFSGI